jgi:hypothetical protein
LRDEARNAFRKQLKLPLLPVQHTRVNDQTPRAIVARSQIASPY